VEKFINQAENNAKIEVKWWQTVNQGTNIKLLNLLSAQKEKELDKIIPMCNHSVHWLHNI
jgi:hypothetical protein